MLKKNLAQKGSFVKLITIVINCKTQDKLGTGGVESKVLSYKN